MLLVAAAAVGARGQCRWKQTGGCSPDGRREPGHDRRCDAVVPSGASGYCSCADGSRVAESHCNHKSFRCRDKCDEQATATDTDTPAEAQPAREVSVRSASPASKRPPVQLAFKEESCRWLQTGGCSSHGRREPNLDKDCNELIKSSISGWCDCGQGRVAAKVGCGHTPFRCSKRCERAYTPREAERQARNARIVLMATTSDTCDHSRFPTPRCLMLQSPMPIAQDLMPNGPTQAMNRQERQGMKSRQSPRRARRWERKQQKKLQKQKQQKQKGNVTSPPRTAVEIATSNEKKLRALARRGRVAVSHTNAGNLPFARNWFASLMRVGVPNWAIFATDEEAYEILHAEVRQPCAASPSLSPSPSP